MRGEGSAAITENLVRDVLIHLYDNAYLQAHPLLPLLVTRHMPDPLARTQHLRNLIITTISSLKPVPPVVARSREWRPYGILVYRYLDGMSDQQIQRDLGISERQFFRDLKAGVALLTGKLQAAAIQTDQADPDALSDSLQGMGVCFERLDLNWLGADTLPLVWGLATAHKKIVALTPADEPAIAIADAALSRQALISALSHVLRHATGDVAMKVVTGGQTQAIYIHYEREATSADDDAEALMLTSRLLEEQGGFIQRQTLPSQETMVGLHWRRFEKPTILIVDDNPGMARLFARYLAGHGYRVASTTNGREAVDLAANGNAQLVLLDVMMRDMDGWAVLQQLKADRRTQGILVLICSVINEPELAMTLGAAGLIAKPVSREQLLHAVARIVGI